MAQDKWTQMYHDVARESWQAVNDAANEDVTENGDLDGCELNLYVFANGSWTIDNPQYIPTTNGCVSVVPVALYNGPMELAEDIEANEDWDAIEDAEREDGE